MGADDIANRALPPIVAYAMRVIFGAYDVASLLGQPAVARAVSGEGSATGGVPVPGDVPAAGDALAAGDLPMADGMSTADNGPPDPGEPFLPPGSCDPLIAAQMEIVRAAEALKSFLDAESLTATGDAARALMDAATLDPDERGYDKRKKVHDGQALQAVAHELALLTGASQPVCGDRARMSVAHPTRCAAAIRALHEGRVSFDRFRTAWRESSHLRPLKAAEVMDRCLAPARVRTLDQLGRECSDPFGGIPVGHKGFRQRINRQLALAEGEKEHARRKSAERIAKRDVRIESLPDGVVVLGVEAERTRAFASWKRVDELARAARKAGDGRPLNQLRSDIATTLLMHGTVPGDTLLDHAPSVRLDVTVSLAALMACRLGEIERMAAQPDYNAGDGAGQQHLGAFGTCGSRPAAGAGPAGGRGCRSGDSSGSDAGGSDGVGVGEVPGLGYVSAEMCRRLFFTGGTLIRRLVTEPLTGKLFDAATSYRVPAGMAEFVRMRDGTCRSPGCDVPASSCDLDHDVNYDRWATRPAAGQTHPDNLSAKHRAHHNQKTRGFWSTGQSPSGRIRWQTLSQLLETDAFDYESAGDEASHVDPDADNSASADEAATRVEPFTPDQAAFELGLIAAEERAEDRRAGRSSADVDRVRKLPPWADGSAEPNF